MASPLKGCNLIGTLVAAASNSTTSGDILGSATELGMAVGTVLASGVSAVTATIALPSRKLSCLFLVKLSSGPCTFIADTASNGLVPTFSSPKAVTVVDSSAGQNVFVGPLTSYDAAETVSQGRQTVTTVSNTVALKMTPTNNATVSKLALLCTIVVGNKSESHTIKQGFSVKAPPSVNAAGMAIDGTGVWDVNT